jgi:hypothetical protein
MLALCCKLDVFAIFQELIDCLQDPIVEADAKLKRSLYIFAEDWEIGLDICRLIPAPLVKLLEVYSFWLEGVVH